MMDNRLHNPGHLAAHGGGVQPREEPVERADDGFDPHEESALVAELRAGNPAAYERVVRALSGRLLAVARRILLDDHEAQDALQDAFVSAFRSIGSFDEKARLSTWLHRVTVNAALMRLRKKRRRDEVSYDALSPGTPDTSPGRSRPEPVLPSESETIETRRQIREAIDRLPELYRIVLVLRDIEGLDTAQTASLLELTEAAVKIRLHRARQALRESLKPLFEQGDD